MSWWTFDSFQKILIDQAFYEVFFCLNQWYPTKQGTTTPNPPKTATLTFLGTFCTHWLLIFANKDISPTILSLLSCAYFFAVFFNLRFYLFTS